MKQEDLKDLIQTLLAQEPAYRGIAIPDGYEGKRRLFRDLMNLWQPGPLPERFWQLQDELLQEELRQKGIVDGRALPEIPGHPRLALWQGDITRLAVDAIVNAANSQLLGCFVPGHFCIDNVIHSAAGLQLREECEKLMRAQGREEPVGRAKLTRGYNLPACYVLHTVGPRVTGLLPGENPSPRDCRLLAECYRSCLALAVEKGLKTVAFCCISTGVFGFPQKKAAEIALMTVEKFLAADPQLEKVIFNVFLDKDREIYQELLDIEKTAGL